MLSPTRRAFPWRSHVACFTYPAQTRRCSSRRTGTCRSRSGIRVPRYTKPPVIEQLPSAWDVSRSGGCAGAPVTSPSRKRCFAFEDVPSEVDASPGARWRRREVDSSYASWPTSPIQRSPVDAVEREAPRVAQPEGPDLGTAAAVGERVVGRDRVRRAGRGRGSMRRILPSSVSSDWPLPPVAWPGPSSPALPPSPSPM